MAQFMGLDIFDKLYDTATNDIKDVNALIRNFRKTDFTSELAQKETDLNSKREEYDSLDTEKLALESRKGELEEQIVELSQQIIPIQGNLDIDELNRNVKKIETDLTTWGDGKFDKIYIINVNTKERVWNPALTKNDTSGLVSKLKFIYDDILWDEANRSDIEIGMLKFWDNDNYQVIYPEKVNLSTTDFDTALIKEAYTHGISVAEKVL
jgi:DNA-binding transcriptional MerR regulator